MGHVFVVLLWLAAIVSAAMCVDFSRLRCPKSKKQSPPDNVLERDRKTNEQETVVAGVVHAAHAGQSAVVRRSTKEQTRIELSRGQCDLVLQLLIAEHSKCSMSLPLAAFYDAVYDAEIDAPSDRVFVSLAYAQLRPVHLFAARHRLNWLAEQMESERV